MSTESIANRLVELCRSNQFETALEELYHDNISSVEMPGLPNEVVNGKPAVLTKTAAWFAGVEEMHGCEVSAPQIAGSFFSVAMTLDVTFKNAGRIQVAEICVYQVADNKIVREQFFYAK